MSDLPGTSSGAPALELRALTKAYGPKRAVDGLDLEVRAGELYALLGPNGAGKTTTLRMVAGLLRPDAGEIQVFGVDARADPRGAKRLVAWLPDEPMLYDKLTPLEYLEFVAGLWDVEGADGARPRAELLLKCLGLWEERGQRCEGFSRGMKQKAALAGALIHDPRLLILDEPLTGLDAAAARQVKDLLQERTRAGGTVILTTHILEVAERLADRIGIIHHGRLLAEGTLDELRSRSGGEQSTLEDLFLQLVAEPAPAGAASDPRGLHPRPARPRAEADLARLVRPPRGRQAAQPAAARHHRGLPALRAVLAAGSPARPLLRPVRRRDPAHGGGRRGSHRGPVHPDAVADPAGLGEGLLHARRPRPAAFGARCADQGAGRARSLAWRSARLDDLRRRPGAAADPDRASSSRAGFGLSGAGRGLHGGHRARAGDRARADHQRSGRAAPGRSPSSWPR